MTHLKGADALALHKKLKERNAALRSAELDSAKALAHESGKERFNLEKLESICDTTQAGRITDPNDRQAIYEQMYYVEHPKISTLQEFARIVVTISSWS
ncbi:hypothetical protein KCU57_02335 [Xanthomonas translucens]|uniref:hypothetical protein n=1 Tax=Xanthomonas campestris pv. translucens TaxID=343 RepID=UPI001F2BEFDD|nr:hypothetical protein [Xanthomonas translucens]UKE51242.1 hypothetical protein KCU57_02335 [Xanthomonas translucens]